MFLRRKEIDDDTWNRFVETSPQGSIYHQTWYLDIVCPNWCAIVIGSSQNWNAVFPLPCSKKMGIHYALQPIFAQYLGVLFRPQTSKMATQWANKKKWCKAILQFIPPSIKLFKFAFAPQFDYPLPFYWQDYQLSTKYSYWLSLNPSVEKLQQGFTNSIRQSITKCEKAGIRLQKTSNIHDILTFAKTHKRFLSEKQYQKLPILWEELQRRDKGLLVEMRDESGKLHTGSLFLKDKNRWINIFGCNANPESKSLRAGAAMLAQVIVMAKDVGMKYFDFEGSMMVGVERFYRNFGGSPVPYLLISKNTLPPPLKWFY